MTDALLAVDDLHTYLGESHVIQGVSLAVPAGQVVALLGRNGAGKTTLLRSIMRMVAPRRGRVTFEGRDISQLATFEIARARIAFVQETRAIFPSLSVAENLAIAARAVEPGSGRVSSARLRASSDALCARTIELARWPLASLASAPVRAEPMQSITSSGRPAARACAM